MDRQQRLFRLAPVDLHIVATHGPDGWSVQCGMRRQDEHWDTSHRTTYSHLSTAELLDVLEAEIPSLLGFL